MREGDSAVYFRRTSLSSSHAKEKVPVTIRKVTECKAKVTRSDNGRIMWVNRENLTVVRLKS